MHTEVNLCLFSIIIKAIICSLTMATQSQMPKTVNNSNGLIVTSHLTFPYTINDNKVSTLDFNYSFHQDAREVLQMSTIIASLDKYNIVKLEGKIEFHIEEASSSGNLSVSVRGLLPGRAVLYFHGKGWRNISQISNTGEQTFTSDVDKFGQTSWLLYVERLTKPLDTAFNVVVILLVVLTNIGMGAKVDLSVVKSQLKKPVAPIIGMFSQFVFMPLIAFTVVYTIEMDPGIALGLFALGCSPGGSASNAYTFLLDGNVSLSVTMTLISTLASLGFLPMWLFTLGRMVYKEANIKIPFENIFFSLLGIIIPVVVGLILQRKFPKVASYFIKAVKYIMILFILFVMTVGVYANLYIFSLMSNEVLLAAALLPYLGFILGGLSALICRQDMTNIITIAVETGIQNTGIPIVLLRMSLSGPDKDTSIVAPVASAIFTPLPLIFGIMFVQIRKFMLARKASRCNPEGELVQSKNEYNKTTKESGDFLIGADNDDVRFQDTFKHNDYVN